MSYNIDRIEPLETLPESGGYSKAMAKDMKKIAESMIESNDMLAAKLESIMSVWTDFIKALKDIETTDSGDDLKKLIEQNELLIKQNDRIVDALESMDDRINRISRSSRGSTARLPSHEIAPRKYPRIKIVK